MKNLVKLLVGCALCGSAFAADWSGWGGKLGRNMVNDVEKGMPSEWDVDSGKNIKWVAELGSQSYGNPVVSNGKIFVGTNNEGLRDPKIEGDKGVIMCFSEADGKFLWQAVFDKLPAGRVNDWPLQGICSTAWVEGDRLYFVNNRCELVCCDTEGFLDGENDGFQDEQYKGDDKADIVWKYDMIEELGVFPHNLATSSPFVKGDTVFLVAGNGVDEGHLNLPSPEASSFVAFNKQTGELIWDYFEVGQVLHGSWSSPAYGEVNGQGMILNPGGDGWLYALDPATGDLIWKFNLNPSDSVWELGGYGTRNNIIATPVFHNGYVYLGVGQDPEHGTGIGHFFKLDASGKGDVTATAAKWHIGNKDFGRTMSSAAVKDGLVYISDLEGYLFCLDDKDGSQIWKKDLTAATWGSPMVVDGKVYIGDEDGDICIMKHGREKVDVNEVMMDASVYTTPSAANGVLYIATKSKLYAIAEGTGAKNENAAVTPAVVVPAAPTPKPVAAAAKPVPATKPAPAVKPRVVVKQAVPKPVVPKPVKKPVVAAPKVAAPAVAAVVPTLDLSPPVRRPVVQIPEVTVTAPQAEASDSILVFGGNAMDVPVLDSLVTAEVNQRQLNVDLKDSLKNVAGVTTHSGNGVHDFFVVRGFDSLDGATIFTEGVWEPEVSVYDLYNIEAVHVLKGPGSFHFGGNSLAGSVNLIRKKPVFGQTGGELETTIGSYSTFRAVVHGNLAHDANHASSLNAMYETSDGYREGMDSEKYAFNPSLRLKVGTRSEALISAEYAHYAFTPDAGIPTLGPTLVDVDRKRSFQNKGEYSDQDLYRVSLDLRTDLGPDTMMRNKTYFTSLDWDSSGSIFAGFVAFGAGGEPSPRTLSRYQPVLTDEQRVYGHELELQREMGMHTFSIGGEYTRIEDTFLLTINPTTNIDVPTGFQSPAFLPPQPENSGDAEVDIFSTYATGRTEWSDQFATVIGGRVDWIDFDDGLQNISRSDTEFSPFGGLLFHVHPKMTLFANASRGFAPPSTQTQGERGKPEESIQYEGGVKFACDDCGTSLQLAVFNLERDDIAIPDTSGVTSQTGSQESNGVELEFTQRVCEFFSLAGSYAYLDSELNDFAERLGPFVLDRSGATAAFAPEHVAQLWADIKFGGGLGVATGVRYVGEQFISPDNSYQIEDYAQWDGQVYFEQKDWRAAMTVKNITDEDILGRGTGSTSVRPENGTSVYGTLSLKL
jgi:TonB-dependent siderophore receptor